MFYHAATQTYIREGTSFELDGQKFDQSWLNRTSPQEKAAKGIVECVYVGTPEDPRYFFTTEDKRGAEIHYINTPKPQEMIDQMIRSETLAKIALLEANQGRAVREAALGRPAYLQEIEDKIQQLRSTL